jgi:hypothetical protein
MSGYFIHDGGRHDFPSQRELEEDAYYDSLHYAEVESMEEHYADEIDGRCEPPVDDIPPATAMLTNAPGQLRFSFGAAY